MQSKHITYQGHLVFEYVVLDQPFEKTTHMDHEACFLYTLDGSAQLYSQQQQAQLEADLGVLMRCGYYSTRYLPNPASGRCAMLAIHFFPETIRSVLDGELATTLGSASGRAAPLDMELVRQHQLIGAYVQSILTYLEQEAPIPEALVAVKIKELLLLLWHTTGAPAVQELLHHLFDPAQLDFKQFIELHAHAGLPIAVLAEMTHRSVSSFKRTFKQLYHCSPGQYFQQKRLEKAASLLLDPTQTIASIAYILGYSAPSNFSKAFAAHHGCTPSVYRQQLT